MGRGQAGPVLFGHASDSVCLSVFLLSVRKAPSEKAVMLLDGGLLRCSSSKVASTG